MKIVMPSEAAHSVRAHLVVIGATASELANCTMSSKACLEALIAARATFDKLAIADVSEHAESCLTDLLEAPRDPLFCAAERGVVLMEVSSQHLRFLGSFADAAEEAMQELEHSLQRLVGAVAGDETLVCAAHALHIEATGIVSTCAAWVRRSAALAQQLAAECELMQERLLDHAHCRRLALSVLQKAKHRAMHAL